MHCHIQNTYKPSFHLSLDLSPVF